MPFGDRREDDALRDLRRHVFEGMHRETYLS
jgi:hypothetical protein